MDNGQLKIVRRELDDIMNALNAQIRHMNKLSTKVYELSRKIDTQLISDEDDELEKLIFTSDPE